MILIISPAKNLNTQPNHELAGKSSIPIHLNNSIILVKQLARMSPAQIGDLMNISRDLAGLNFERFQSFSLPFSEANAKQALLTFNGHTYQYFDLENYTSAEFDFAQQHLRILSGLYGLLKPLDLIQPYRLEMGTKLANERGDNLYAFWGDLITQELNTALAQQAHPVLINLASNEYYGSIKEDKLDHPFIHMHFQEERDGGLKTISVYAKQARGAMADFVIKEKIEDPNGLKAFTGMGYHFNQTASTPTHWVFSRPEA